MSSQTIIPCTCSNINPNVNYALLFLFLHRWLKCWRCCPPGDVGSWFSPKVRRELGLLAWAQRPLCTGTVG